MKKFYTIPAALLAAALTLVSCQKSGEPEMPPARAENAAAQAPVITLARNFLSTTEYSGLTAVAGGYKATAKFKLVPAVAGNNYNTDKFTIAATQTNYSGTFTVVLRPVVSTWDDLLNEPSTGPVVFPNLLWTKAAGGTLSSQGTTWKTYNGQPLEFGWCATYEPTLINWYDLNGEFTVVFDVTDVSGNTSRLTLCLVPYL